MLTGDDRYWAVTFALVVVGTVAVAAIAVSGFAGTVGASSHGIDSCTEITQPGTYEITSDIRNTSNEPCIEIKASDVTIEGNGHSITSTTAEPSPAIDATGLSNLAIRNVTTLYWGTGVQFADVTDSEISGVVTDTNTSDVTNAGYSARFNGIELLSGSDNNVLRGNQFYDAGRSGEVGESGNAILVDSSHDNLIVDNTVSAPAFTGIRLWNAHRNNLTGNTIEGNPYRRGSNAGIKIGSVSDGASDDNRLLRNDVYGRTLFSPYDPGLVDGIAVLNGDGNVLVDNYVDETASEGIIVTATGTTVYSNIVTRAGDEGIAVFDPANVTDNTVTASGRYSTSDGIRVSSDADNSDIIGNTIRSTDGDGLSIDGVAGLEVRNNGMKYNSEWSVELTSMPTDVAIQGLSIGDLDSIMATGVDFKLRPGSISGVTLPVGKQDIGIAVEAESTSGAGFLELDVRYNDADVAGIDESTLSMWRYDSGWSEVAGTNGVNTSLNLVFAETGSFSQFVPLADNDAPTAALTASSTTLAPGESVTFNASASVDPDGTIDLYQWDFDGDGTTDATTVRPTASHSYATTGTYDATVTVVDDGDDNDTGTVSITVESKPVASLSTSPSPTSIDMQTTFDASASTYGNGTIVEYRWDFDGDGMVDATTTSAVTNHTYASAGNYSASVTAVGDDGTNGTATAAVTVKENLPPNGFGLSTGCVRGFNPDCENWVGDDVSFNAQLSGPPYIPSDPDGTIVEYRWDLDGDGTVDEVGSRSTSHVFQSPGTYTVTATAVDDDGAMTSRSIDIEIDPRKYGTITGTLTNATSGESIPNATVTLYEGSGPYQTLSNFTTTDANGTYEIEVLAVEHNVTVDPVGYAPDSTVLTVTEGGTSTADFHLTPDANDTERGTGTLWGYTYDGDSNTLTDVTVEVRNATGVVASTTSDDFTGEYSLTVPATTYEVVFSKSGYEPATELVTIAENGTTYLYPSLKNATTGGSATPALFNVTIDSTNSPITAGDTLNVTATVENTGGAAGTQTVTLSADGIQRDSASVSLSSGASQTVEFAWSTTDSDAGNYTATVGTANDSASVPVGVLEPPASFEPTILETNSPVLNGSDFVVTAEVTNTGNLTATKTIKLIKVGAVSNKTDLTLAPGESTNVTLSVPTDSLAIGNHTLFFNTEDFTVDADLEVVDPAPARFEPTILETNSPVLNGSDFVVTAEVTNTGDLTATKTIKLTKVGTVRNDTDITLAPGESTNVTLSVPTDALAAGNYTLFFNTEDFTVDADLEVINPDPALFEPTILETNSPVLNGSDFVVTAEVVNTGDLTATKTIKLTKVGTVRNDTDITLAPGESTNVTLSVSTDVFVAGNYTLFFNTEDFTVDAELEVVDPAPASFQPTILETNSPVFNGSDFIVTAEVTNTGDLTATKTIKLTKVGTVRNDTDITLAPGESTNVTLSVPTDALAIGNHTLFFNTEDFTVDADLEVIDPDPALFEPTILDTNSPVINGSDFVVTAEVTNTGDLAATKTIKLTKVGTVRNDTDITLAPGESTNLTLSVSTEALAVGSHTLFFNTEDFTVDADLTVIEPGQAFFDVTIDSTASPITAGETLNVTVTVENIGNVSGTRTVRLLANESTVASTNLTLAAGTQQSVTLSWVATNDAAGNYTATVSTGDDSDTAPVEIKSTDSSPVRTISPGQPGFGATVAIVALLAAVLIGARRRP